MTRVLPKITIRRVPDAELSFPVEAPIEARSVWFVFAAIGLFFAACLVFGAPEPVDCGVDRDAPTLDEGCGVTP
jgi:hypothetical protein